MSATARLFSGAPDELGVGLELMPGGGDIYRSRERSVRVQTYVPESFRRRIEALGRAWSVLDAVNDEVKKRSEPKKSDEPLKPWSESDVVKRLLEAALEQAWEEVEGGEPKSEEDWARIEASFRRKAKLK